MSDANGDIDPRIPRYLGPDEYPPIPQFVLEDGLPCEQIMTQQELKELDAQVPPSEAWWEDDVNAEYADVPHEPFEIPESYKRWRESHPREER